MLLLVAVDGLEARIGMRRRVLAGACSYLLLREGECMLYSRCRSLAFDFYYRDWIRIRIILCAQLTGVFRTGLRKLTGRDIALVAADLQDI